MSVFLDIGGDGGTSRRQQAQSRARACILQALAAGPRTLNQLTTRGRNRDTVRMLLDLIDEGSVIRGGGLYQLTGKGWRAATGIEGAATP
jgi:predicted transcriptional regulator